MGTMAEIILTNKRASIYVAVAIILISSIIIAMPVSAETPTLHVTGTDMAPGFIYIGEAHAEEMDDIVMLQIILSTTDSEDINITSIIIHRAGIASDAEVENVDLYEDSNGNGSLDGADQLLSTAEFQVGRAEFSVSLTVSEANPLSLLVALDISSEAISGRTVGVEIPDQSYIDTEEEADVEFEFDIRSKNSTILLDTDGDLNPDSTDLDDDDDGYTDESEQLCGSDSKDPTSVPADNDNDFVPDSIDTDDDDDGEPDEYDDFPMDASRQRDYTIIYVYAIIAVVLIIVLIFLGFKGKPRSVDKKALLEEEGEDEFDIGAEEEDLETEGEMLEDEELDEE